MDLSSILTAYSQSQQSISSNNQSYEANVVFVGDKVGDLSTCILSLTKTNFLRLNKLEMIQISKFFIFRMLQLATQMGMDRPVMANTPQ